MRDWNFAATPYGNTFYLNKTKTTIESVPTEYSEDLITAEVQRGHKRDGSVHVKKKATCLSLTVGASSRGHARWIGPDHNLPTDTAVV